ncbi:MAG TPA: DUF4145 domain-containing protein [Terriglobia bacterium]|nr:DUF4145 domain-containing protein [Terriglobia bacterium]
MTKGAKKIVKVPCNNCAHPTNHRIVATRETRDDDDEDTWGLYLDTRSEMLECCGCAEVKLRQTIVFSEDPEEPIIKFFPPAVSRRSPTWLSRLPPKFRHLMKEVYEALHADSCMLAMMGVRTLIDMVIVKEVGDQGNFPKGVEALKERGLVSSKNAEFLATAIDAGSAAAHRGHRPDIRQVNTAMDITENLLQAVYALGSAAAELKKITPPRPPRAKKVGTGL